MTILEEFDTNKNGIIEPHEMIAKRDNFPKYAISCFSYRVINRFVEQYKPDVIAYLSGATGRNPIYKFNYKGNDIALYTSRVGSPASVIDYEEITAMGAEKIVISGSCGVLDKTIDSMQIIVPNKAFRDEGTSYHYLESSPSIDVNTNKIEIFEELLKENNLKYAVGATWTTDAPYRETKEKMDKRKKDGCIVVEMECSALFAVAKFRNKELFQYFFAADNLDGEKYDKRNLGDEGTLNERDKLMILSAEMVLKL